MTRIAAEAITIPATAQTICIETWDEDGVTRGIIWDRTGRDDQDGEWATSSSTGRVTWTMS